MIFSITPGLIWRKCEPTGFEKGAVTEEDFAHRAFAGMNAFSEEDSARLGLEFVRVFLRTKLQAEARAASHLFTLYSNETMWQRVSGCPRARLRASNLFGHAGTWTRSGYSPGRSDVSERCVESCSVVLCFSNNSYLLMTLHSVERLGVHIQDQIIQSHTLTSFHSDLPFLAVRERRRITMIITTHANWRRLQRNTGYRSFPEIGPGIMMAANQKGLRGQWRGSGVEYPTAA